MKILRTIAGHVRLLMELTIYRWKQPAVTTGTDR
jgi:hypothetical protein